MPGPAPAHLPDAQDLFDGAPCGLLVTSTSGTILKVNRTLCRWIGREREELVGLTRLQQLLRLGGGLFEQARLSTDQAQNPLAEVKFEMCRRDGRSFPVIVNAVRRAHVGGIYYEVSIVVAEERKKHERELWEARAHANELLVRVQDAEEVVNLAHERLEQALSAGGLSLWEIDAESQERRYDDRAAALLGFDAPRPIDQALFASAVKPEDREADALALARVLDGSDALYSSTYRLNGVDGLQRTVTSTGRAYFNDDGSLARFVGVLAQATEAERARIPLEKDGALFAEQLSGIVNQDLGGALWDVLLGVQAIARNKVRPTAARSLFGIVDATQSAQRTVFDLLDFTSSRIGKGLTITRTSFDVHELVAAVVERLASMFEDRNIQHVRSGDGHCHADADRLAQVLGSLVSNAIFYGDADGPVTVASAGTGDSITLSVHNVGNPVRREALASLFEPLARAESTKSGGRRVSLGLYIVREIARAHGGEATVTSTPAEGTTLLISFPRGEPAVDLPEAEAQTGMEATMHAAVAEMVEAGTEALRLAP